MPLFRIQFSAPTLRAVRVLICCQDGNFLPVEQQHLGRYQLQELGAPAHLAQRRVQATQTRHVQPLRENIPERALVDVQQRAGRELRTSVWPPRQGLGG